MNAAMQTMMNSPMMLEGEPASNPGRSFATGRRRGQSPTLECELLPKEVWSRARAKELSIGLKKFKESIPRI